jgi:hypothetical protein
LVGTIENLVSIDLTGCNCGDNVIYLFFFKFWLVKELFLLNALIFKSLKGIANSNLRHSSFSGCKDITDLGLQKFSTQCPNLETLDLSNCYQLTDNSIKSLAFCCKFMMNLNLSGCVMVIINSYLSLFL